MPDRGPGESGHGSLGVCMAGHHNKPSATRCIVDSSKNHTVLHWAISGEDSSKLLPEIRISDAVCLSNANSSLGKIEREPENVEITATISRLGLGLFLFVECATCLSDNSETHEYMRIYMHDAFLTKRCQQWYTQTCTGLFCS